MSDDWIILIPDDPLLIPHAEKHSPARDRLAEITPEADEVKIRVSDTVEFFHCGANYERIVCPACGAQIPLGWWQERMDEDYGDGFKLAAYPIPCCNASRTLNELVYAWPQGFARFALDAMNPHIGLLDDLHKQELERILGTTLRVIYQHI